MMGWRDVMNPVGQPDDMDNMANLESGTLKSPFRPFCPGMREGQSVEAGIHGLPDDIRVMIQLLGAHDGFPLDEIEEAKARASFDIQAARQCFFALLTERGLMSDALAGELEARRNGMVICRECVHLAYGRCTAAPLAAPYEPVIELLRRCPSFKRKEVI